MSIRRVIMTLLIAVLLLVPVGSASADDHCAPIKGTAMYDFGNNVGLANVTYDGQRLRVPFEGVGFEETGRNMADIEFLFYFPQGVVYLVEHSVATPKGGPTVEFNSTIDVLAGASGAWTWSGTANGASGRAAISTLSGDLCFTE